jgi:hypothetical protein
VPYQKESDDDYLFLKHSQVCCVGTVYHHNIFCQYGRKSSEGLPLTFIVCGKQQVIRRYMNKQSWIKASSAIIIFDYNFYIIFALFSKFINYIFSQIALL